MKLEKTRRVLCGSSWLSDLAFDNCRVTTNTKDHKVHKGVRNNGIGCPSAQCIRNSRINFNPGVSAIDVAILTRVISNILVNFFPPVLHDKTWMGQRDDPFKKVLTQIEP